MKKQFYVFALVFICSFSAFSQDPGWPRQLTHNGSVLVLYTPQVEDWPEYKTLNFRMAFSLTALSGKGGSGCFISDLRNNSRYLYPDGNDF